LKKSIRFKYPAEFVLTNNGVAFLLSMKKTSPFLYNIDFMVVSLFAEVTPALTKSSNVG